MNFGDIVGTATGMNAARGAYPQAQVESEGMSIGRAVASVSKGYATLNGVYWGTPGSASSLESGFYMVGMSSNGPTFTKKDVRLDDLLRLPDPVCDILLEEFVGFWSKAPAIAERGLNVKRGLLLWGPPGSGKTSALQIMAHHMVTQMNGIVFLVQNPRVCAEGLQVFRAIEPNRPVICLYEDIDAIIAIYGESDLLALLDGELQINGVVNVATTNYPECLDRRFVDRPGRFDRITFVGMPAEAARAAYFAAKAPDVSEERRATWVRASEGWSMAHLREMIVATLALGEDEAAVVERLNEMRDAKPNSDQARRSDFGFGRERRMMHATERAMIAGRGA